MLRQACCVVLFLFAISLSVASASDAQQGLIKVSVKRGELRADGISSPETIAVFLVETAADRQSLTKGLGGREMMPCDRGMLFVLDMETQYFFWMKGMKFPLDILIFDRARRLIDIYADLAPCEECPLYKPPLTAAYALEINAGLAKRYGIKPGDSLVVENE
ncbi:MAG: DUF192 domain-containing protein [Nitrospirae bacterium]|nr:DUF192 domain-containing protein [Nitrospirota bacterium]